LAASSAPGSTTPAVRGFTALPGTVFSGTEERAAANLVERVLFSDCAAVSESVRVLVEVVRRAFSLEREASSFFREVMSEVRDWRSVICCLRALITAS
jgi:hypothetical protein